jgi:hypothetical protein
MDSVSEIDGIVGMRLRVIDGDIENDRGICVEKEYSRRAYLKE